MAKIRITEEDILAAEDYMPIALKEEMSRLFAQLCAERLENPNSTKLRPLPPVYRENRRLRQQISMGTFAKIYLKRDIRLQVIRIEDLDGSTRENALDCCMETEMYDEWAASHVMNQMERLKASRTEGVRNKVFDILYDFKCFENMLFGAIRDELEMRNDFADRFTKLMDIQTGPEAMSEALKLLEELKEGKDK